MLKFFTRKVTLPLSLSTWRTVIRYLFSYTLFSQGRSSYYYYSTIYLFLTRPFSLTLSPSVYFKTGRIPPFKALFWVSLMVIRIIACYISFWASFKSSFFITTFYYSLASLWSADFFLFFRLLANLLYKSLFCFYTNWLIFFYFLKFFDSDWMTSYFIFFIFYSIYLIILICISILPFRSLSFVYSVFYGNWLWPWLTPDFFFLLVLSYYMTCIIIYWELIFSID